MARYNEIRPEDLVVLKGVRVHAMHFDERFIPYFEVASGDAVIKVRARAPEIHEWIKAHQDVAFDLTIFPYSWAYNGRSGVVNYFRFARVM